MRITACAVLGLALLTAPAQADERLQKSESVYKQFCSHCHGIGMVNPGTSSYDLRRWPTDQRADFEDAVINGRGDMPAWGDILLPDELDLLWYYVATRAGKEPFPEQQSKATDGDAVHQAALPEALRVCLAQNGGVMSSRRHDGGTGLDYGVSRVLADRLGLPLEVTWFESEQEEESDPVKEISAMLSYGLCDVAPGVSLSQSTLRPLDGTRAALPRWKDRPDHMQEGFQVDIQTLIASRPYARVEMGIVVHEDHAERPIRSLADLDGLVVGIEQGTLPGLLVARQAPSSVAAGAITLKPGPEFLWRMENGAFDAALVSVPAFDFHTRQNAITRLRLTGYRHPLGFNIAVASLAEHSDLVDRINAALDAAFSSGEIAAIADDSGASYALPQEPWVHPRMSLQQLLAYGDQVGN